VSSNNHYIHRYSGLCSSHGWNGSHIIVDCSAWNYIYNRQC